MENQIDQLYDVLLRLDEEKDNKELYQWLENICQKQFGLVDGLVANFIDNIDDATFSKKILKVLKQYYNVRLCSIRKLNEHLPNVVVKQFLNNQKFPGAIVKYLETTDLKDMAGDAFILLVNVFNDSTIDQVSERFLKQLISSLEFITDENTQNALISIFIVICASHEKKMEKIRETSSEEDFKRISQQQPNLALLEFIENESFYRQKLLHLTNRGNKYRFDKCLETINIILKKDISQDLFNINDMNLLIDICLREIQREKKPETRVQILRMIETIMENPNFQKYPYKVEDIKETINELILYEDEQNGGYSLKEKEYIAKLNLKFQFE